MHSAEHGERKRRPNEERRGTFLKMRYTLGEVHMRKKVLIGRFLHQFCMFAHNCSVYPVINLGKIDEHYNVETNNCSSGNKDSLISITAEPHQHGEKHTMDGHDAIYECDSSTKGERLGVASVMTQVVTDLTKSLHKKE